MQPARQDEARPPMAPRDSSTDPQASLTTRDSWLLQLGAVEIRPLSAADHEAYCAFAARLERDDLRLRFAGFVKLDCAELRAQLLALDHNETEALAAFANGEMLAIAHLVRTQPAT